MTLDPAKLGTILEIVHGIEGDEIDRVVPVGGLQIFHFDGRNRKKGLLRQLVFVGKVFNQGVETSIFRLMPEIGENSRSVLPVFFILSLNLVSRGSVGKWTCLFFTQEFRGGIGIGKLNSVWFFFQKKPVNKFNQTF